MDFEAVHNFYKPIVIEHILARAALDLGISDPVKLTDILALSLSRLPPRYVLNDIDATNNLSAEDHDSINKRVATAVNEAIVMVKDDRRHQRRD
ncbi:MAG: late competence development ComFB family protein [Gammaproteobacteria bacterium]|nr:late competence development ComFB family protein [Gammaproteobacteria bacterium]